MDVKQMRLLDFFEEPSVKLEIPPYQRVYSWTARQCYELWLDILAAARDDREHFSGIVIMTREAGDTASLGRLSVVDGQQRLTTTTLLLLALARYLEGRQDAHEANGGVSASHDGASAADDAQSVPAFASNLPTPTFIRTHLLRGASDGEPFRKLSLSRDDDAALAAAIDGDDARAAASKRIAGNLAFFGERMAEPDFDPATLWEGLGRLFVIACFEDNVGYAQEVFESANSKGLPLTLADMVRNYLLLEEEPAEQERLYDEYWAEASTLFDPDPGARKLNAAITAWISIRFRARRMGNPEYVYSTFKHNVADQFGDDRETVLLELRAFCFMWREQYRYHAVRKFLSRPWAVSGATTLTQRFRRQKATNQAYAESLWKKFDATDDKW